MFLQVVAEQTPPSRRVARDEELAQMQIAISWLPEAQGQAITLHHLQGLTLVEVATRMNRSLSAVAGLLHRGLRSPQQKLEPYPPKALTMPTLLPSDESSKENHSSLDAALEQILNALEGHSEFDCETVLLRHQRWADELRQFMDVWFGLGIMGLIGWSVVVPTLLGAAVGAWLDSNHPASHSWTLALLITGLLVGCWSAWQWVAKEDKAIRDE